MWADKETQRLRGMFDHCMRISIADRYSANLKAEMGLQQDGFLDWAREAFQPCGIHRLHSSIKNATDVFSSDISGLLNLGLACQEVGSTRTMRGILTMIFEKELIIDHSPPPGGKAEEHRRAVFDLYLPIHGAGVTRSLSKLDQKRRCVLRYFCNGDLSQGLRHHCLRGCCADHAQTRRHFAHFVTWALCPHKLPVLSRKTWTGFSDALSWTGVLSSHHCLFQKMMAEFMRTPGAVVPADVADDVDKTHTRRHRARSQKGWMDSVLADATSHVNTTAQSPPQPLSAGMEPGAGNEAEAEDTTEAVAGTGAADTVDWAELKRQQKKGAKAWLETHPAPRLAVLTSTIAGFQGFLSCFLRISSVKWRKEQEHHVLQTGQRSYPVLEMSRGEHVQGVFQDALAAIPLPMPGVPDGLTDAVLKGLRFRAFSAGLSAVHLVLRVPHNNMPYQFFELYTSGQFQRLLNWPKCCLDGLSATMLEWYGTQEALESAECKATVEAQWLTAANC